MSAGWQKDGLNAYSANRLEHIMSLDDYYFITKYVSTTAASD